MHDGAVFLRELGWIADYDGEAERRFRQLRRRRSDLRAQHDMHREDLPEYPRPLRVNVDAAAARVWPKEEGHPGPKSVRCAQTHPVNPPVT